MRRFHTRLERLNSFNKFKKRVVERDSAEHQTCWISSNDIFVWGYFWSTPHCRCRPSAQVEFDFCTEASQTAVFSNSFLGTGVLCLALPTSDLFRRHEIFVVVVRADYCIYCISQ